jgi:hypothetical protein
MNSQNEALNMLVQNMGHLGIYLSLKKGPIFTLPNLLISCPINPFKEPERSEAKSEKLGFKIQSSIYLVQIS